MSKSKETQVQSNGGTDVKNQNSLDYSKAEATVKNITIPNSQFKCKWVEGEGYAIGYENVKLTRGYETLEKALNQIGYGVDKDEDGDEILVKVGEVDYELIARIVRAVAIVMDENKKVEENV